VVGLRWAGAVALTCDAHISESRYGAPGFEEASGSDGVPGSVGGRKTEAGE
jgi:hypothetical protein